jgi:hypothetical protein
MAAYRPAHDEGRILAVVAILIIFNKDIVNSRWGYVTSNR